MALQRRWIAALAMVAVLAAGARASCDPLPDPYMAGYYYDISPLTNNANDYRAVYSTSVDYQLQFCRTLVASPDPTKCPESTTLVCERFQASYNPVGVQPTNLTVAGNGQLTFTYAKGTTFATVVTFICDNSYPSPTSPLISVNGIGGPIQLTVRTKFACSTNATSTPVPTTPAPTTAVPTTPAPACSVTGTSWRAQYYDTASPAVLVSDELAFNLDATFRQELRPYPTANCTSNAVDWSGTYKVFVGPAYSMQLDFVLCTQDAVGCLRCGPTSSETVDALFRADCTSFVWSSVSNPAQPDRTYYRIAV